MFLTFLLINMVYNKKIKIFQYKSLKQKIFFWITSAALSSFNFLGIKFDNDLYKFLERLMLSL